MYTPGRDGRFEYLWELMHFIEDNQCHSCVFSKMVTDRNTHGMEYPMCWEIEGALINEEPVPDLDDRGDEGVVCTRYRNAQAAVLEENQDTLF